MALDATSGDFGSKLREARERRGVTLRQISNSTKISVRALEALERNDFARLPGGLFSRAFVRSYALEVGLEPEETVREFIGHFPHDSVTNGHRVSEQVEDRKALGNHRQMASTPLWLLAISLLAGGLVLYFVRSATRAPAPPPAIEAAASGSSPASDRSPAGEDETRRDTESVDSTRVTTPRSGATLTIPPPVAPAPPDPTRLVVELSLTGRSWISAIADGQRLIGREMEAGERQVLEARQEVELSVGNASAVVLTLNGAPARSLGKPGQVVTLRMNLANFKEYLATP